MSQPAPRSWTGRITAQVLAVGLAVAGLAALGRQEPPVPLSAEPAAVSTSQIGVTRSCGRPHG